MMVVTSYAAHGSATEKRQHGYRTPYTNLVRWLPAAMMCVALAGCSWFRGGAPEFTALPKPEARAILCRIAAETAAWHAVKFKFDCEFVMIPTAGKPESQRAGATCLWMPGRALRVRLSRLGMSVADILFDGRRWYLTDEAEGVVYVCNRIDGVQSGSIQHAFLAYLQTMPNGWWAAPDDTLDVAANGAAYRIIERRAGAVCTSIFPAEAAIPSEIRIAAPDGAAFTAWLGAPDTNATVRAVTFTPALAGYEVHDSDAGTVSKPK